MELGFILRSTRFRIFNLLIWLFLFLISWLRLAIQSGQVVLDALLYEVGAYFIVLWLLSPLVGLLFVSMRMHKPQRQIMSHVLFAFLFGAIHFFLTGALVLVFERLFRLEEHYTLSSLWSHFANGWPQLLEGAGWYLIILLGILVIKYYLLHKNDQSQIALAKAKLQNTNYQKLSAQLSPHFLFNAMNSIAMMVRKKEDAQAVGMIANLSDMLRAAMSKQSQHMVSLESEIEMLEKYLELEEIRFRDRVAVTKSFAENTLGAQVPQFVLQPLVENAFKHGVADAMEPVTIRVASKKVDADLQLSVYNSGKSKMNWDITSSKSLGLSNTVHRLRQAYESSFKFKVIEKDDGLLFEITIPFSQNTN